jgi:hypothetical protein
LVAAELEGDAIQEKMVEELFGGLPVQVRLLRVLLYGDGQMLMLYSFCFT